MSLSGGPLGSGLPLLVSVLPSLACMATAVSPAAKAQIRA